MTFLNKFRTEKKRGGIKENIVEHLTDLFNTKKSFGSFLNDFGLDSYIYFGSDPRVVSQMEKDIKKSFEKYEKRVKDVEVISTDSESPFLLSFVIKCKIESQACSFHLRLNNKNKSYNIEVKE